MSIVSSNLWKGDAASIRLHIVREAWLPAEQGPPGCHVRISVLKHRLAAAESDAQVLIRFADEVGTWH